MNRSGFPALAENMVKCAAKPLWFQIKKEKPEANVLAPKKCAIPPSVQYVMDDEQRKHDRACDLMECFADQRICHQHGQQNDHADVDNELLPFHLNIPSPSATY